MLTDITFAMQLITPPPHSQAMFPVSQSHETFMMSPETMPVKLCGRSHPQILNMICAPLDPLIRPRRALRSETQVMSAMKRPHVSSGGTISIVSAEPLRRSLSPRAPPRLLGAGSHMRSMRPGSSKISVAIHMSLNSLELLRGLSVR